MLIKQKADKEEDHAAEMNEIIVEEKASASVVVQETKIKLVEDLENVGSCDTVGQREALFKLTGNPMKASQDLVLQPEEGEMKEKSETILGGGNKYVL